MWRSLGFGKLARGRLGLRPGAEEGDLPCEPEEPGGAPQSQQGSGAQAQNNGRC